MTRCSDVTVYARILNPANNESHKVLESCSRQYGRLSSTRVRRCAVGIRPLAQDLHRRTVGQPNDERIPRLLGHLDEDVDLCASQWMVRACDTNLRRRATKDLPSVRPPTRTCGWPSRARAVCRDELRRGTQIQRLLGRSAA